MRHAAFLLLALLSAVDAARAASTCEFDTAGGRMRLLADCTTDAPIEVPDGITLDGAHHVIVAVDPEGGAFAGGIIVNAGGSASVVDTTIVAMLERDACQAGSGRLRGISFDGASGRISGNTILNVNRGVSDCQEGNAIELRNRTTAPIRVTVEIDENTIEGYQKSGIVANGPLDVRIRGNTIGASATQAVMPANALQIGPGALATVEENAIRGNSWGGSDAAATAILIVGSARGTTVRGNDIRGNSDVGIYVMAEGVRIEDNRLSDSGADGYYDIGIGNYGSDNVITGNEVRGFERAYEGGAGGVSRLPARVARR